MDDTRYLVCSALLISIVVSLINPLLKLYSLLRFLFKIFHGVQTANQLADGVRSFEEMPGPKGIPLLGDLISFLMASSYFKERMAALKSAFKRYGPVIKRTVLGHTVVFIEDPKDVETVFKADGRYPRRPDDIVKPFRVYFKSRKMPTLLGSL